MLGRTLASAMLGMALLFTGVAQAQTPIIKKIVAADSSSGIRLTALNGAVRVELCKGMAFAATSCKSAFGASGSPNCTFLGEVNASNLSLFNMRSKTYLESMEARNMAPALFVGMTLGLGLIVTNPFKADRETHNYKPIAEMIDGLMSGKYVFDHEAKISEAALLKYFQTIFQ
jgi:hypothetical protein